MLQEYEMFRGKCITLKARIFQTQTTNRNFQKEHTNRFDPTWSIYAETSKVKWVTYFAAKVYMLQHWNTVSERKDCAGIFFVVTCASTCLPKYLYTAYADVHLICEQMGYNSCILSLCNPFSNSKVQFCLGYKATRHWISCQPRISLNHFHTCLK